MQTILPDGAAAFPSISPDASPRSVAHRLAMAGLFVFPAWPCEKAPATPHGFHDATCDVDVIHSWWSEEPDYNPAVATGASGIAVLDVDYRNGGAESLKKLIAECGELPETVRVETADGYHDYFYGSARNSAGALGKGLDVRGRGGYVIAPNSCHPEAGEGAYRLVRGGEFAPLPDFLAGSAPGAELRIRGELPKWEGPPEVTAYGRRIVSGWCSQVSTAPSGCRNNTLNRAAFRFGRQMHPLGTIPRADGAAALRRSAALCGLPAREAEATIWSGIEAGRRVPQVPPWQRRDLVLLSSVYPHLDAVDSGETDPGDATHQVVDEVTRDGGITKRRARRVSADFFGEG